MNINWGHEYRQNVKNSDELTLSHASGRTRLFCYYRKHRTLLSIVHFSDLVYDILETTQQVGCPFVPHGSSALPSVNVLNHHETCNGHIMDLYITPRENYYKPGA
jgi:hypothetical protein